MKSVNKFLVAFRKEPTKPSVQNLVHDFKTKLMPSKKQKICEAAEEITAWEYIISPKATQGLMKNVSDRLVAGRKKKTIFRSIKAILVKKRATNRSDEAAVMNTILDATNSENTENTDLSEKYEELENKYFLLLDESNSDKVDIQRLKEENFALCEKLKVMEEYVDTQLKAAETTSEKVTLWNTVKQWYGDS